ncbi:MAG: patatin-like phospholipase family protein [Mesorhizobium sp.]|uniref:patatin-like phospholipase family protein n=1 Tax=Mesorhizobium sp. TaxID=1871066 RepID=UPI0012222205|nr:patatin-like phospholipase family protein [Mesorhizobium sp.]TIP29602.1 MAG: patatin-like phospholipase family protein [Mesorhizobium sp.]
MPTNTLLADDEPAAPEKGIALALSGGGYRAMVFHLGALIRLNEAGLLKRLSRISSVSGGSITAAVLGLKWRELSFGVDGVATNLDIVVDAVRMMAATSVDAGAIIGGILLPGTIGERVAAAYDKVLFGGATLQDFPDDRSGQGPRFILNATNVQSAALWRFAREYMGDYRVGLVRAPTVPLAMAVAASSAFPPVLSPLPLKIAQAFDDVKGADLTAATFRRQVFLSDGGVYDNLGLETIEKRYTTLLVSDAGQKIAPEASPATDWTRHSLRVLNVIDNQVRSLRQRRLIDSFNRKDHSGCYWSIRADFADYEAPTDPLGCTGRDPRPLAAIPTRLQAMSRAQQGGLVNWGYAICDAALRRHFGADAHALYGVTIVEPKGFPIGTGY